MSGPIALLNFGDASSVQKGHSVQGPSRNPVSFFERIKFLDPVWISFVFVFRDAEESGPKRGPHRKCRGLSCGRDGHRASAAKLHLP